MTIATIADKYQQPIEIKTGYEAFFAGVIKITQQDPINQALGEALRQHASIFLATCNLDNFCDFADTHYTRTYLGKNMESGWEALMMCWCKGNRTSIHGHPQFAAYNFASGRFLLETFQKDSDDRLHLVDSFETEAGQSFYAIGNACVFDNHIHRITCLSDTGRSLHIYSDDARKGKVFVCDEFEQ